MTPPRGGPGTGSSAACYTLGRSIRPDRRYYIMTPPVHRDLMAPTVIPQKQGSTQRQGAKREQCSAGGGVDLVHQAPYSQRWSRGL